jgi:hypothetical protein
VSELAGIRSSGQTADGLDGATGKKGTLPGATSPFFRTSLGRPQGNIVAIKNLRGLHRPLKISGGPCVRIAAPRLPFGGRPKSE